MAHHPGQAPSGWTRTRACSTPRAARFAGQPVELRRAQLADPLPAGPFDLVVSALAVHHLSRRREGRRSSAGGGALRPGGRFVLGDVVVPEDPGDAVIAADPRLRPALDRWPTSSSWLAAAGFEATAVVDRPRPGGDCRPTARLWVAGPVVSASIVERTMTPAAEESNTPAPAAEEPLHRALGLTDDEFEAVGKILGRPPNHLELALYAVMWSEHCSYKSSRMHLRRLPTEGPRVLVGPGENAGVIDAGDGIAVAIRIESHNHPSAIEPYQGAATGVGGILRDIFTMGARPLAIMDPLFFGPPDDARQRWLVEGVVSGISGYGNSVGVPTWAASSPSTPVTPRTLWSTCSAWARCRSSGWCSASPRARATWPYCSAPAPGGTASAG